MELEWSDGESDKDQDFIELIALLAFPRNREIIMAST